MRWERAHVLGLIWIFFRVLSNLCRNLTETSGYVYTSTNQHLENIVWYSHIFVLHKLWPNSGAASSGGGSLCRPPRPNQKETVLSTEAFCDLRHQLLRTSRAEVWHAKKVSLVFFTNAPLAAQLSWSITIKHGVSRHFLVPLPLWKEGSSLKLNESRDRREGTPLLERSFLWDGRMHLEDAFKTGQYSLQMQPPGGDAAPKWRHRESEELGDTASNQSLIE